MLKLLHTTALAVATAATGFVTAPERAEAQSYQIDCAILLCLSGGWPASVPCARARAEFIRRITPWPIEPPLQIWRCPMGAAFDVDPSTLNADRIYDILMDDTSPHQSFPTQPLTNFDMEPQPAVFREGGGAEMPADARLLLVQQLSNGTADIDIGGPEFNFVRSIKVWDVRHYSHVERGRDNECSEHSYIQLGAYERQGGFGWGRSSPSAAPTWVIPSRACRNGNWRRGVGVEWNDYAGNHGYEWVAC